MTTVAELYEAVLHLSLSPIMESVALVSERPLTALRSK